MSIETLPPSAFQPEPLPPKAGYRGRIAPTPTGLLHLGHARTFWTAFQRARACGGLLVYRNEDLDRARCREEWVALAQEDLRWLGLDWQEGPDRGGAFGPYDQSQRMPIYRVLLARLQNLGAVYPCYCSRRDVALAAGAPHGADEEPLYPGYCRPDRGGVFPEKSLRERPDPCWRFRAPESEVIEFEDGGLGPQRFVAGHDFGDFVVWSRDDIPSYQLAVVADDSLMKITEVVRGADLLLSTARQILLYRALNLSPPAFHHTPLVTDSTGARLAKRHNALSLRHLRRKGVIPAQILEQFNLAPTTR